MHIFIERDTNVRSGFGPKNCVHAVHPWKTLCP